MFNVQYEKAAAILAKNDPPITLAKVDTRADINKPIAKLFKIKGYPTLRIIRNGGNFVQQEYRGPRKAQDLVSYVNKQLGPASVQISSADDAATLIDPTKIFIVSTHLFIFALNNFRFMLTHILMLANTKLLSMD